MARKKHIDDKAGIRLRVVLKPGFALGPGKADLLEGIAATGSIAAGGRRIGMSYKRAWTLIEEMNTHFDGPVVEAANGGVNGGGAVLTELGAAILKRYRAMEAATRKVIAADSRALTKRLRDISDKK